MPEQTQKHVIKFNKTYLFENQDYTEVDLSGLENLSTEDLINADNQFSAKGQFSVMNEMAIGYSCIIASMVTPHPVTFFEKLPAKEGLKIKREVMGFLSE